MDSRKNPRPERAKTDESLRTERKNTDHVLAETRTRIEAAADGVVAHAREQADSVLDKARDKADDKLDAAHAGTPARDAVARERAGEDEALKGERASADETLRRERAEQARMLAALLPLEREKTDRFLLTERERSDDAVMHRDDFLGIVSHDLRNLLGGIADSARLLLQQAGDSDEARKTIAAAKRIERYVARMNRLIGDLVDIASIDEGRLAMKAQPGDAAALIAEAVEVFAYNAKEKHVVLRSEVTEALPGVFDHDRMLQVLANLITNAIKFTASDGTIVVRGELTDDGLHMSVGDTGIGISAGMHEAAFERFWQAGENDRRGTGLGLYISRCIVNAHGGRIWVESKLGAGSTFHVVIPSTRGHA